MSMQETGWVVASEPDTARSGCGNPGGGERAWAQAERRRRMGRGWARGRAWEQQEQEGSLSTCPTSAPDVGSSEKGRCLEGERAEVRSRELEEPGVSTRSPGMAWRGHRCRGGPKNRWR